jgi:hypothetical protein
MELEGVQPTLGRLPALPDAMFVSLLTGSVPVPNSFGVSAFIISNAFSMRVLQIPTMMTVQRFGILMVVMTLGCGVTQSQQISQCSELRAIIRAKIQRLQGEANSVPLPLAAIRVRLQELTEALPRLRGCVANQRRVEVPATDADPPQNSPISRPSPEAMMERTLRTHRPTPLPQHPPLDLAAIESSIDQLRVLLGKSRPDPEEIRAILRKL